MKAIQSRATFTDLPEAKFHFDVMASQDRFLGGRVVRYHKFIFVQFFLSTIGLGLWSAEKIIKVLLRSLP